MHRLTYTEKLALLRKEASIGDAVASVASYADKAVRDYILPLYDTLRDHAMVTSLLASAGGAYLLSKATAPTAITSTSDKRLYLESLRTEVAAARRRVTALENKNNKEKANTRVFDKFLG